jgi:hypothetical protein
MTVSLPKSNSTLESPTPVAARPQRKPQADIYTILLALAFVAVLVAILFLWLYMKSYNYETKGGPTVMTTGRQSLEQVYNERGRGGEKETRRPNAAASSLASQGFDSPASRSSGLPLSTSWRFFVSYS